MGKKTAETSFKNYRIVYDYHTHTIFSHGKGRIEDNVKAALEKGLSGIAITDHGPGHLTYGLKRSNISIMREEIERLKEKYTNIDIYLGVEANIVDSSNGLDITKEEFGDYDFVIAGYHYGVKNGLCVRNFISNKIGKKVFYKSLLVKNTEMAVRAIYENKIKILTHPGDKGPFDILELAKACIANDTLMEISTWHNHLTFEELKICKQTEVKFIVSSDAHVPERVGDAQSAIERAFCAGIEPERIVNIKKIIV